MKINALRARREGDATRDAARRRDSQNRHAFVVKRAGHRARDVARHDGDERRRKEAGFKTKEEVDAELAAENAKMFEKGDREYIKARAAALAGHGPADNAGHGNGHEAHWAYEGENGPQKWGAMKPEFNVCAIGKRQSPIHIEETATLPGPAEPLQISYQPSGGSVVNNGHTIQVDLEGDNTLTVRGSVYKLVQFHFHHPAEEKVNYKGFAMVAHLVHRNDAGQLAVVAVLMDPGAPNPLIHNVWTHMPLDTADRVKLPAGAIDMNKLLPQDQRYYQFIGSLTTPPCTEGVLWLVLKQPMTLARDQLKMFSALFPNNARPTQPLHGRLVREAQ